MKAKENASLAEEQVGVVEIPYRVFNMVVRDQRARNRIIVGNCRGECFRYIRENSMIKGRGRHGVEKGGNGNVTRSSKPVSLNMLF
jgi:hypothetical protein